MVDDSDIAHAAVKFIVSKGLGDQFFPAFANDPFRWCDEVCRRGESEHAATLRAADERVV